MSFPCDERTPNDQVTSEIIILVLRAEKRVASDVFREDGRNDGIGNEAERHQHIDPHGMGHKAAALPFRRLRPAAHARIR